MYLHLDVYLILCIHARWDEERAQKIWIHIVDEAAWQRITGESLPADAMDAREMYAITGIPWFEMDDAHVPAVAAAPAMAAVKSMAQIDEEKIQALEVHFSRWYPSAHVHVI